MKKVFVKTPLLITILLMHALISGCGAQSGHNVALDFITMSIRFPDVPELGKPTKITFSYTLNEPVGEYPEEESGFKAWVEFYRTKFDGSYIEAKHRVAVPIEEVVLTGSTTWEGSLSKGDTIELTSTISFPEEGIWDVIGYVREDREYGLDNTLNTSVRLAITEESSGFFADDSLEEAGLGYLKNADYGHSGRIHPNEVLPVAIELNMPKPPLVNEEVEVTCTIRSIENYQDYFVELGKFLYRTGPDQYEIVLVEEIVVSGTTSWKGDLENGSLEEFSFNIRFPKAGDWLIPVSGESPEDKTRSHNSDSIALNVTDQRSSYGWEDLPNPKADIHGDEVEVEPLPRV